MKPQVNEHLPAEWIAAYYDGELRGETRRRVEGHLSSCADCRTELDSLRALSKTLQEAPQLQPRTSRERFTAQVMLKVPHSVEETSSRRAIKAVWKAFPAAVLAGWAFLQAASVVATFGSWLFASLLPQILPGFSWNSLLVDGLLGAFSGTESAPQGLVELGGALAGIWGVNLILTMLLAGLMLGWLASWWAAQRSS